jgi:hypothetical protein
LVIENTGDFHSLKQKVDAVWQRLQAESSQTASAQRLK